MRTGELNRKRRVERIQLVEPILGVVPAGKVVILDLSLIGCRIESHFAMRVGSEIHVEFEMDGTLIEFDARVVRCSFDSFAAGESELTVYHSGLEFLRAKEGSGPRLRAIIEKEISSAIEEQKANARGDVPKFLDRMPIFAGPGMMTGDATRASQAFADQSTLLPWVRIARHRGYLQHLFDGKRWKLIRTRTPDQPKEGFTVWAYENSGHVAKLREAYERGDDDARSFIRLCAELSLEVDDSIPPQRFQP